MAKVKSDEFTVQTVWKNFFTYGANKGKPYWTFVLEDGSRVPCYSRSIVKGLEIDTDEKRTNFDPPETFKLYYELRKDKTVIVSKPDEDDEEDDEEEEEQEKDEEEEEEEEKPKKKTTKASPAKTGSFNKFYGKATRTDSDQIARMNVLRTAVEFTSYQKTKTLVELQKNVALFESYVLVGKFKDK